MTLGQRVAVLHKGVVQQVDSPQRLYRHPANTFVASFIGSPPMNFVRGRLDDGAVDLGGYSLHLPDEFRRSLRAAPTDVLVGLRPEHFADARRTDADSIPVLPAEIEVTEQLGPETYAYFRVDGLDVVEIGDRPVELAGALTARLDPRTTATPGAQLPMVVQTAEIRLFDAETGEARSTDLSVENLLQSLRTALSLCEIRLAILTRS
jgi:multiple sugar transport system ATP-binding protein